MKNKEMNKTKKSDIFSIDPRAIQVMDGFNSRSNFNIDELAEQIREQGVLNPITVQSVKDEDGTQHYRLIDGERRYRAVMKLLNEGVDIPYIKAIVIPQTLSKAELYMQQAMRNEGEKFNEYEWGILANKMKTECSMSVPEIAKMLGKNAGVVTYWLQILEMPEDVQALVRDNKLCGADVRRILQGNNKDFDEARKDIEQMEKKAKEKGEKKLSIKDLDITSNTILFKDSKALLKGLNILMKYIEKYAAADGEEVTFDIGDIHAQLKEGKLLDEIFNREKGSVQRAS